jgi:hypothetical protein
LYCSRCPPFPKRRHRTATSSGGYSQRRSDRDLFPGADGFLDMKPRPRNL